MAHIGTFTRNNDGGFTGTISTLMLRREVVIIVPVLTTQAENGPDYRVLSANHEIGAGWKRQSEKAGDYVTLIIDDPSFTQPLRANLFTASSDGNTLHLIWTRSVRRSASA